MRFMARLVGDPQLGLGFDDGTEISVGNEIQTEIDLMARSEGKALGDIQTPGELATLMGAYCLERAKAYREMAKRWPALAQSWTH